MNDRDKELEEKWRAERVAESDAVIARANGHKWRLDDGGLVDRFALDEGYHNGPGCEVCGYSFCIHCYDEPQMPCPGFRMTGPVQGYDDSKLDMGLVAYDNAIRESVGLARVMDLDTGKE